MEDEDSEPSEEGPEPEEEATEKDPQLADYVVHALAGYSNPHTMKVGGLLKHQPITVLIDTDSTNNFLNSKVAARLTLQIKDVLFLLADEDNGVVVLAVVGVERVRRSWPAPPPSPTAPPPSTGSSSRPSLALLYVDTCNSKAFPSKRPQNIQLLPIPKPIPNTRYGSQEMATRHLLPLPLLPIPLVYKTLPRFPSKPFGPLLRTLCSSAASSSSYSSMASTPKKVLLPIANGTEPMEAVITIDVLRRAGADVTVASTEKELCVDACWGVKLVADALVADGGLPGSATLRDCGVLESIVKKQAEKGGFYAAICAAPAVALGSWGLLKGLKVTCYPSFMDKLPSDATAVESRVQVEGQVVTSRGPGTAMEYSLALVEKLYGKDKADEVAGPMVNTII
ncbi:hypothetical protein BHE74_00010420 [Ensete ventricosum]|nr:hypothetical protein BHE74_00010420 [Ensete ventricosum]